MLAGKGVKACQRCYNEEAQGCKSHRLVENEVWQKRLGAEAIQQLVSSTTTDGGLDAPVQYIDLRLGNTCNLQCIMCEPLESSRWLSTAQKLAELSHDRELKNLWDFKANIDNSSFEWYRNREFWANLQTFLPHVKEIILAGGEPFLIKEQFAFVKACCELGEAGHIRLRYHTNATVFPEEMVPYWEQFEIVHTSFSASMVSASGQLCTDILLTGTRLKPTSVALTVRGEEHNYEFSLLDTCAQHYHIPTVLGLGRYHGLRNRRRFSNLQDTCTPAGALSVISKHSCSSS